MLLDRVNCVLPDLSLASLVNLFIVFNLGNCTQQQSQGSLALAGLAQQSKHEGCGISSRQMTNT